MITVINLSDLTIVKKGKLNYLGEWHTRPNTPPIPSPKDTRCSCSISLTSFNDILLRSKREQITELPKLDIAGRAIATKI